MRIALLTLVFIVSVTATPARARLGETPDQLVARYGQALSETDQKAEGDKVAESDVIFQKGGFQIEVTVSNGISVAESFKKINGEPLTIAEVRTLLAANSEGHGWEAPQLVQGEKLWSRDDAATARLAGDGTLLSIKSKELIVEQAVAKKLERQPSLDGF
jgi:hypothetical protein